MTEKANFINCKKCGAMTYISNSEGACPHCDSKELKIVKEDENVRSWLMNKKIVEVPELKCFTTYVDNVIFACPSEKHIPASKDWDEAEVYSKEMISKINDNFGTIFDFKKFVK